MKLRKKKFNRLKWLGIPLVTFLAACGGSSGNDNADDTAVTLSGSVFASAVSGAHCEVKDRNNDVVADPFISSEDGSYSVTLPGDRLAEDLIVECTGGTFTDEATGLMGREAGKMAAYIVGGTSNMGTSIHVTPSSTIIHDLMTHHGKTAAEAAIAFDAAFGFTADYTVAPTDASNPAQGAEEASLLSGLRAAAFSQLASDLNLLSTEQFALFSALAEDLADGLLDGQSASGTITIEGTSITLPADIQNRFGRALVNFRSGGRDASGLANNKIGTLPFAKVAMTDLYNVEYLPDMHGAVNGKTAFTLKINDHNEMPQTGLDVSIKPKMNMAGMVHTTPFEAMCSEGGSGEYSCTTYYLMPSVMEGGMSMGFWELKVMIGNGDEHAIFYPAVKMAMGDTAQVRLKGQNDKISSGMGMMNETENRTYFLFKNTLTGMTDDHTFELFIAAKENMMSFPAVYTNTTLSAGDTLHELLINTISVEVSTDAVNWINAAEKEGYSGRWVASGMGGLTEGTAGTLYVKLGIDGEQKTTDGKLPNALPVTDDANNHYAKFNVTPGSSGMSM